MRIIGYIDHPTFKITVFRMDNKLSVKFETGLYEQTYKFRESDEIKDFSNIERLVDSDMLDAVSDIFGAMHRAKNGALNRVLPADGEEEFEEII